MFKNKTINKKWTNMNYKGLTSENELGTESTYKQMNSDAFKLGKTQPKGEWLSRSDGHFIREGAYRKVDTPPPVLY